MSKKITCTCGEVIRVTCEFTFSAGFSSTRIEPITAWVTCSKCGAPHKMTLKTKIAYPRSESGEIIQPHSELTEDNTLLELDSPKELPEKLRESWAASLLMDAYELQMKGELDRAIDLYGKSIAISPSAEAYTFLGWTFSFLGKLDISIELCKKAIETDADFGNPYNDIGAYLIQMGQFKEAIPWLEKAAVAKRYESPFFAHCNLGRVWERLGDHEKAQSCYVKALELDPSYLPAREAILRMGKIKEGETAGTK